MSRISASLDVSIATAFVERFGERSRVRFA